VSTDGDSISTPLVRGLLAALSVLGIALAVVAVPALAAQVAGTASSATALDAVLIGLNLLVLGHGGGIVLSTGVIDGAVTLTPVGLQVLLVLVAALSLRRVGHRLHLVRDDGVLRVGALRDAGVCLAAFAGTYAIGLAVLAAIGRSADAAPVVTSAVVSGALVAVGGGLIGLLWSLRREPTSAVPGVRVLELLPTPYGAVARAALIAVLGLFGAGLLLVLVLMVLHVPAQSALFDQLAPGIVGGLVLVLLQLALLPLLAVWALVVLLGGTVVVGTSTGISLGEVQVGVLPALPILGALPEPGALPGWAWALMLLPAIAVGAGTVSLVRDVAALERREQVTAWIAYPVVVVVAVLLLAGLATGGIGDGRLVHLGPRMGTLVLPLLGVVVIATGLVLLVLATDLVPWTRRSIASLRERVDAAESHERDGGQDSPSAAGGDAAVGSAAGRPAGDDPATARRAAERRAAARRAAAGSSARDTWVGDVWDGETSDGDVRDGEARDDDAPDGDARGGEPADGAADAADDLTADVTDEEAADDDADDEEDDVATDASADAEGDAAPVDAEDDSDDEEPDDEPGSGPEAASPADAYADAVSVAVADADVDVDDDEDSEENPDEDPLSPRADR
jgi:hypothetical protein